MAELEATQEHSHYNQLAMKYSQRVHQARAGQRRETEDRDVEALFPAFNRAGLGVLREYERMGGQPVSVDLAARAKDFGVKLEHLGVTLGTVLHNVRLKEPQSPEFIDFVRACLLERKVIFFRDQHLTEDEQVAFGRKFGELDAFPFGKPGENPYILEIIHGKSSPGAENGWHTDVTWMERPSLGSIAQCVETPPHGGDTLFSDSHACYLGLPAGLQERIRHLHGINDYRIFVGTPGASSLPDDLIEDLKADIPFGVSHPLVRTHPETGKLALYIHGGFLRHDSLYDKQTNDALDAKDSKRIVTELLTQHSRPEYTCRFAWQPGSIAFWDNRAVQHYAASDYYPHRRVLRRVTVSGDTPF